MSGFRETVWRTHARMDVRTNERTRLLRSQRPVGRETKKLVWGVSWLPTVFLAKKFSKYRLKRPKYIVLGTPKKPDKTPKNGENRFWVIKLCFLAKLREPIFDPRVTNIFYWSPAFRICTVCLPNYEWNLTKIRFKNTYFEVFQGFPALRLLRLLHTSSQIANFGQFLAKMAKTVKIIKKRLEHFSRTYKP